MVDCSSYALVHFFSACFNYLVDDYSSIIVCYILTVYVVRTPFSWCKARPSARRRNFNGFEAGWWSAIERLLDGRPTGWACGLLFCRAHLHNCKLKSRTFICFENRRWCIRSYTFLCMCKRWSWGRQSTFNSTAVVFVVTDCSPALVLGGG